MEIIIPEKLSEVSVRQFLKFKELDIDNSSEDFLAKKMISIFCNVEMSIVNKLSLKDFRDITYILTSMLNQNVELIRTFTYKGVEFGFIPNLDKMTLGEYVDIDNAFKDEDINSFLQVVYRPIVDKKGEFYRIKKYEPDECINMLDLPYDVYKGAEVFFYLLGKDLLNCMKNYLQQQEVKMMKRGQILEQNGVGINQLVNSLEMILENLTKLRQSTSIQHLHTYVTSKIKSK